MKHVANIVERLARLRDGDLAVLEDALARDCGLAVSWASRKFSEEALSFAMARVAPLPRTLADTAICAEVLERRAPTRFEGRIERYINLCTWISEVVGHRDFDQLARPSLGPDIGGFLNDALGCANQMLAEAALETMLAVVEADAATVTHPGHLKETIVERLKSLATGDIPPFIVDDINHVRKCLDADWELPDPSPIDPSYTTAELRTLAETLAGLDAPSEWSHRLLGLAERRRIEWMTFQHASRVQSPAYTVRVLDSISVGMAGKLMSRVHEALEELWRFSGGGPYASTPVAVGVGSYDFTATVPVTSALPRFVDAVAAVLARPDKERTWDTVQRTPEEPRSGDSMAPDRTDALHVAAKFESVFRLADDVGGRMVVAFAAPGQHDRTFGVTLDRDILTTALAVLGHQGEHRLIETVEGELVAADLQRRSFTVVTGHGERRGDVDSRDVLAGASIGDSYEFEIERIDRAGYAHSSTKYVLRDLRRPSKADADARPISSGMDAAAVPYASIERVSRLIELVASGVHPEPEALGGSTTRHVGYVETAARILGVLGRGGVLTSSGMAAARMSEEARLEFLAAMVEDVPVIRLWMKWAGTQDIRDVDPNSARRFLEDLSIGTETIRKQRTGTLRKWLRAAQELAARQARHQ